jgi:hypothetical protein
MLLQTILNRLQRQPSFAYRRARFRGAAASLALEVAIEPRANGRPVCSGCVHGARGETVVVPSVQRRSTAAIFWWTSRSPGG